MGERVSKRLKLFVAAALAAASSEAHAQQAPPAPPPPPPPAQSAQPTQDDDEEIVVIADQGDQVRIDRRVYTLRDDPAAQTSTMLDVLPRVPAVTVSPSGQIRLLGGAGVTIQIDGQNVPESSLDLVLRSIRGADVERIEVITNPSAEHSAQGASGVINIITRQRHTLGLGGGVTASADNSNSYSLNIGPNWSRGPWMIRFGISPAHGEFEGNLKREREDLASSDIRTQVSQFESISDSIAGNANVTYRPDARRRFSINANAISAEADGRSVLSTSTLALGPVSTQIGQNRSESSDQRATAEFEQRGAQPNELFKINLSFARRENENRSLQAIQPAGASPPTQYTQPFSSTNETWNSRVEFERPLGPRRVLTFGGAFEQRDDQIENALQTLLPGPGPADFQRTLFGVQSTQAAYLTFQFPIGDWLIRPGARGENYRREVRSNGPETDTNDFRVFPSLHIRRELTDKLDLDLSYSSRIQRPDISQLDPAVRFSEPTRASTGNPNLRPTTTDAYEATLLYRSGPETFSVTLFDRASEDIFSQFTQITPAGVTLNMPVNAGSSKTLGVQASLRGRIARGWRYSFDATATQRAFDRIDPLSGAVTRRDAMEYDGRGMIEYRDANQSEVNADQVSFDVQFQNARNFLQGSGEDFFVANFAWRRRLTPKIYGVLRVADIFDSRPDRSTTTTSDYIERSVRENFAPRIQLSLTYQLGNGAQPEE